MNATYFNHETTMESIVGGWKHHKFSKKDKIWIFWSQFNLFVKFIYLHSTIVSCYELTHHQTFYSWVNCPGHI